MNKKCNYEQNRRVTQKVVVKFVNVQEMGVQGFGSEIFEFIVVFHEVFIEKPVYLW